jgi:hypothetical protein
LSARKPPTVTHAELVTSGELACLLYHDTNTGSCHRHPD